jgi:hypothetical protein
MAFRNGEPRQQYADTTGQVAREPLHVAYMRARASRAARSSRASVMKNGLRLGTSCGPLPGGTPLTARIVQEKYVMLIMKCSSKLA